MRIINWEIMPLTKATYEKDAKQWLNIIKYHESGTVIQLQANSHIYIPQMLSNIKTVKSILGPYYRKYLLGLITLDSTPLSDALRTQMFELATERKLAAPLKLGKMTLKQLLDLIESSGLDLGIFICNTKSLFMEDNFSQLSLLENLLRSYKNFSVIVFTEIDVSRPGYSLLMNVNSSLFTNLIKYPLYESPDSLQFIAFNEKLWQMKLTSDQKKDIVIKCGGYLWLIRQILRFLRNHPEKNLDDAYKDELLFSKLDYIWQKFTLKEKEMLEKVVVKNTTSADRSTVEYQYLKYIHVIKQENNHPILGLPLLQLVINKTNQINLLKVDQNQIYLNSKNITENFSLSELNFLTHLLQNPGKLVPRDQIAFALWGNNWQEKYSDWAIDRLIYRIRKKLVQLSINSKLLQSVKRKGVKWG